MKLNRQAATETAFFVVILLAALFFFFTSCSKAVDNPAPVATTKAVVKFYSSNPVTVTKVINVKVGATDYGRLNYSGAAPTCSNSNFGSISLEPGNYKADYLDGSTMATKQVSFTVPSGASTCVFFDLK